MPSFTSVELDEQRIDMAAALAQGRVYVKQAPDDQRYPYVVLTERYAQDFASVYVGDAWMASVDGEKAEYTMPSPLPVRKDALCALDNAPALKMALLQQVSPSAGMTAQQALATLAERAECEFAQMGRTEDAKAMGQFRSYLDRFGLPSAENQMALIAALTRTTDAVRKVFRDTCEKKPFPRGSECDDKLQALCEGDMALQSVGERDATWTSEKATVASRQGWAITPADDGTGGMTISAVRGGRLVSDTEAYRHVCLMAKQGDLLALTACKEVGIRIAEVNDYKPPVLGM